MLNGRVDILQRDLVTGWCADFDDPNRIFELVIYVDGVERVRCKADRPRPDLQALRIYGDGGHGFIAELVPPLSMEEDHEILVQPIAGRGTIERSHVRLSRNEVGDGAITVLEPARSDTVPMPHRTPRYVLHVGPHKTGSTYLQQAFAESRDYLHAGSVFYPDDTFGWAVPGDSSHALLYRSLAAFETSDLPLKFERLNASDHGTVLISSEDLVNLSPQGLRYLRSLIDNRSTEVVYYCRRWSDLLPSAWQETVKQGHTDSFGEYLAPELADPFRSPTINFDINLEKFVSIFGIESIRLISYSHLVDNGIDLYDHFLRSVLGWSSPPAVTRVTLNRSLDPVDVEMVRLLQCMAAAKAVRSDIDVYVRYARNRAHTDAILLWRTIKASLSSILLRDDAPGLRAVHDFVMNKYGRCLLDPKSGFALFTPAEREIHCARSGCLLAPGVIQAASRLYDDIMRN